MIQKPEEKRTFSSIAVLIGVAASLVIINIAFLIFTANESKTIRLLKKELETLEQEERIIASAQEINNTYKDEIDIISSVFPSEETIPLFIQTLEEQVRLSSDEYNFKFNTISPIKEQEKLLLPLTVTMKTDMARYIDFLAKVEGMPYMMQVTAIHAKSPESFTQVSEIVTSIKLYVQNPFITK